MLSTVNVFLARKLTKDNLSISKHIWMQLQCGHIMHTKTVGSYYMDSIFKSEAGSILVSCFQNLFLDLSKSLIFFSRQVTLLREESRAV